DQNTSGPAHDGQAGRGTSTFRPADTYASTGSGHGHTMATGDSPPRIPPRDRPRNEARRDPSRPAETGKSWPAQRQPGGDIVKEHGQTRGRDAQEIKPSTARGQLAAAFAAGRLSAAPARRGRPRAAAS